MVLFLQAMSTFPPSKWRVRYLKDMQNLACEAVEEEEISMAAYLAVRPSDGEEGAYRFVLHGPDKIKLKFPVGKLLPSNLFVHPIFFGYGRCSWLDTVAIRTNTSDGTIFIFFYSLS